MPSGDQSMTPCILCILYSLSVYYLSIQSADNLNNSLSSKNKLDLLKDSKPVQVHFIILYLIIKFLQMDSFSSSFFPPKQTLEPILFHLSFCSKTRLKT